MFDIRLDYVCQRIGHPNADPVVNRSAETIPLGPKESPFLIGEDELHHGRIMHLLPQDSHHPCLFLWRRRVILEYPRKGITILIGGIRGSKRVAATDRNRIMKIGPEVSVFSFGPGNCSLTLPLSLTPPRFNRMKITGSGHLRKFYRPRTD